MLKCSECTIRPVILMITSSFPCNYQDGQGVIIARLAESLASLNYKIIILAPHYQELPLHYYYGDISVFRFPYFFPFKEEILATTPGMFYHISNTIIGKLQLPFLFFSELIAALLICRKERVDIIHTHWIIPHGIIGIFTGNFFGIPHVSSIHGTDVTIARQYSFLSKMIRFIGKRCDAITVNSSYIREVFLSCGRNLPYPILIPMGVDLSIFNCVKQVNREDIYHKPLILFIGRLIRWKGIHILIQAMRLLIKDYPEASLVIAGDGVCLKKLKELVSKLGIESSVLFTGNIPGNEIISWYSKADIFILPSITDNNLTEGLGVVLLEAMASGVPVIGSNSGGIPDIIEDGVNGLLVPPGDPDALNTAIIRIIEDPDLAEKFRNAGLKTVRERFSWDQIAARFMEIYMNLSNDGYY